MTLTEHETYLIRHTLGLDQSKTAYRNRYYIGRGNPDLSVWLSLVDRNLAGFVACPPRQFCFFVFARAFKAVKMRGEKADREETERFAALEQRYGGDE